MAVTEGMERSELDTIESILDRVDARHVDLSWAVTENIAADIGEYGPIDRASPFWKDVREFGESQIRGALKAARTGQDPPEEDLAVIRAATVRRVEQGVPLQAILHAFRMGHRIVWNAVVEEAGLLGEGRAAALGLTLPFMRFVDTVCTCITETYLDHQHRAARAAERVARDLLELLIAGDPRATELAREEGIELDPGSVHVVIVATVAGGGPEELRRLAETIETRLEGRAALAVIRQEEATFVIPAGRAAPADVGRLIGSDGEGSSALSGLGARVGIGLEGNGETGVADSHRQARSALTFCDERKFVVSLADLPVLEYLISRDDPVAESMVPPAVRELARGEGSMDRALRETVDAYLAAGMNVIKTAASLPAHPNTVHYRLNRLSERTGFDHRDLNQMVELQIAIRLSRGGTEAG